MCLECFMKQHNLRTTQEMFGLRNGFKTRIKKSVGFSFVSRSTQIDPKTP